MRKCKGQTYKNSRDRFSMKQGDVMCVFRTEPFTRKLIAKRHSLSCHDNCD